MTLSAHFPSLRLREDLAVIDAQGQQCRWHFAGGGFGLSIGGLGRVGIPEEDCGDEQGRSSDHDSFHHCAFSSCEDTKNHKSRTLRNPTIPYILHIPLKITMPKWGIQAKVAILIKPRFPIWKYLKPLQARNVAYCNRMRPPRV